jgi:hypothetical protein
MAAYTKWKSCRKGATDMRNATAQLGSATVRIIADPITVKISSHFWPRWSRIAVRREQEARQARLKAVEAKAHGCSDFSTAVSDELDASMEAISAAAHALDTFYGAVKEHVEVPSATWKAWQRNGTPRYSRVLETLKLGIAVNGSTTQQWSRDFRWLCRLRGDAVHYVEASKDTELHPLGSHMAPEHVAYSVETTAHALDLVLGVLEECASHPKSTNSALRAYVATMSKEVQRLVQMRADEAE